MAIFLIIKQASADQAVLGLAISSTYPDDTYELGDGAWLVSDSATAQGVSDKIGITRGEVGSALIVEAASYYGRANPAIWSWIKEKWGGSPSNG